MGEEPPPGGGGSNLNRHHQPLPDQRTGTLATARDSVTGGSSRTFEQILEDEKTNRNILEIQISRNNKTNGETETTAKPKNLTYEDLGKLLFDTLCINPDDCLTFNFNTGRYDQREIEFKPGVDTSPFVRTVPFSF